MHHTVKLKDVIVGHSDLEFADEPAGRAWGTFRPGLGYDLVQPVFRLFTKAVPMLGGEAFDEITLEKYYAARDKLGLTLVDPSGEVIETAAIHIADYLEERGIIQVEALIKDAAYWENRAS
ncbi:hypothetical protein BH09GEM1_BH09GEM1_30110 [soil metagenome]